MTERILSIKTTSQEAMLRGLQREKTNRAVLLYSAGADSTATGVILREEGKEIHPLFIDYGQTAREAEECLVSKGSLLLGFEKPKILRTDILTQLSTSELLGGNAINDTNAWVPGRNSLFLLYAGIYAHQIDADGVAIGFMLDDTGVFGDSDYIHHKTLELLLTQTLSRPMEMFLPIKSETKESVFRILFERGIVDLTVSCWNATVANNQVVTCHNCANCVEREKNLSGIIFDAKTDGNIPTRTYCINP